MWKNASSINKCKMLWKKKAPRKMGFSETEHNYWNTKHTMGKPTDGH